jgi:polyphosphate kinase
MSDTMQSWSLTPEGEWVRHSHADDGTTLGDVQNETMMEIMGRKRGAPTT